MTASAIFPVSRYGIRRKAARIRQRPPPQKSSCKSRYVYRAREVLPYTLGPFPFFLLLLPSTSARYVSLSFSPSLSSFRPSLPKKRLGIYLIDRFTAPEDILSVTVYVYIYISFLSSLGQSCRLEIVGSKGLARITGRYIFFLWEKILFRNEELNLGEKLGEL